MQRIYRSEQFMDLLHLRDIKNTPHDWIPRMNQSSTKTEFRLDSVYLVRLGGSFGCFKSHTHTDVYTYIFHRLGSSLPNLTEQCRKAG